MLRPLAQYLSRNTTLLARNLLGVNGVKYSTTMSNRCEDISYHEETDDTMEEPEMTMSIREGEGRHIIGKDGLKKKFIEVVSGCQFRITREDPCTVSFYGDKEKSMEAQELIEDMLRFYNTGARKDEVVLDVNYEKHVAGVIIGKNGGTKKCIEMISKCKVNVLHETDAKHSEFSEVHIIGTEANTQRAKEMIDEILRNHPVIGKAGEEIVLPQDKIGIVLGKNFHRSKYIENLAHCSLQLEPENPNQDSGRIMKIIGDEVGIKIAKKLIYGLIENHP